MMVRVAVVAVVALRETAQAAHRGGTESQPVPTISRYGGGELGSLGSL
jgi:hypothetical protein